MMRITLKLTAIFTLLFNGLVLNAQLWPFTPMFRFGNTVYYKIDSLSEKNIRGTNITYDKIVTDRFFDLNLKTDSIGININDSIIFFNHKTRLEPKCYKETAFYSKRNLTNPNFKIKYLKLIELTDSSLVTEATLFKKYNDNKKTKETFRIMKSDIDGVFLGTGKNGRRFYKTLSITVGLTAVLILGLK
jgi:hypothetical protein